MQWGLASSRKHGRDRQTPSTWKIVTSIVTPCCFVGVDQRFRGTYRLELPPLLKVAQLIKEISFFMEPPAFTIQFVVCNLLYTTGWNHFKPSYPIFLKSIAVLSSVYHRQTFSEWLWTVLTAPTSEIIFFKYFNFVSSETSHTWLSYIMIHIKPCLDLFVVSVVALS